jgi:hypothetical protein
MVDIRQRSGINRWFYPAMALLLVSVAVIGFTPNSLAILAGTKTSPPLIIHFHAAAMSTWLLLLLTQTVLVASGRVDLHRVTGLASLVVAPIVIMLMLLIAVRNFDPDGHGIGFALNQARRIIIFTVFFVWGIMSRRRDSDTHKRCFFIATIVILDAAFFRMPWLPWFGADNIAPAHFYQLLLVLPLLAYDRATLGYMHKASLLGVAALLISMLAVALAW